MKETDPALNVSATYNVAGLSSLAKVKSDKVMQVLKQEFNAEQVELTLIADNMITAKTTEANQRRIQKKLASLAPPASWYLR